MVVFLVCAVVLLMISCSRKSETIDYMDQSSTDVLKGWFLLLVFLSHVVGYYKFSGSLDGPYFLIRNFMGQGIVVFFLFCSGYGVMEGIKRKPKYIESIPFKRIFKVLWQFDLAVSFFYLLNIALGKNVPISKLLGSFVAWAGLGNSNWYIFCILFSYLFVYIAYRLYETIRKKNILREKYGDLLPIGISILFCVAYIFIVSKYKPYWWYDTMLTFSIGMLYNIYKRKIDEVLEHRGMFIVLTILTVVGLYFSRVYFKVWMVKLIFPVFFLLAIILFLSQVRLENKFLSYTGKNLFGLYILQRLAMIAFKEVKLVDNIYVYVVLCFIAMYILNYLFNKLISIIEISSANLYKIVEERFSGNS